MKMMLRFSIPCILGIYAHEKTRPIPIQCRIRWGVEPLDTQNRIDYDKVYQVCCEVVANQQFDWIEEVTQRIVYALSATFGDQRWQVEVEKPLPYGQATCFCEAT